MVEIFSDALQLVISYNRDQGLSCNAMIGQCNTAVQNVHGSGYLSGGFLSARAIDP